MGYIYAVAYAWVIAQVTPSPQPIKPNTYLEQSFAILVFFCGFAFFSSLLSAMVGKLTLMRNRILETEERREILSRYIEDHHVCTALAHGIEEFLKGHHRIKRKRVHWDDVKELGTLPVKMQMQLRYEVFVPVLMWHPFFFQMDSFYASFL